MSEKKKTKNNAAFYIALCCCVGIIGSVGYFTNREQKTQIPTEPKTESVAEVKVLEDPNLKEEEVKPAPTLSPVKSSAPKEIKHEEPKTEEVKEIDVLEKGEPEEFYDGETVESVSVIPNPSFIKPLDGETAEKFSGDNLIYNKSMGDWRTHNGIDILANPGTDIYVCADGVIDRIYTDYLGNTVIIDHQNGYKTKYSNLDTLENLTIGAKVKQGDFLAKVSDYCFGENVDKPHLHFEIIKNDTLVNPEDYIQ